MQGIEKKPTDQNSRSMSNDNERSNENKEPDSGVRKAKVELNVKLLKKNL